MFEPSPESTFYQDTGRPGMTNIMQNPTLEDNTLSNCPDAGQPLLTPGLSDGELTVRTQFGDW